MFDYTFHWGVVWRDLPRLLDGAVITLQITVLSMALGLAIGILLAVAKRGEHRILCRLATVWIEIARNTPCLLQIYMAYFGVGAFGLNISSYAAVLGAISFNNAGYLAEILRGGFNAVPVTQFSAARSLGMSITQSYFHIVLPQVLRITLRPIMNQTMWALLNTSLGMIIGLKELTGAAQFAQSRSFRTFEFFFVTALIYYAIAKLLSALAVLIGWRLFRGAH